MTPRIAELLDELVGMGEVCLDADGLVGLVEELRAELDKPAALWPDRVMEAVAEHVSPSVWNAESRTYKSLNRRILWAKSVWVDRYGPLTDSQREYMSELLIAAVEKSVRENPDDKRKLYPAIHGNIAFLVNHETVHAGFRRRAEELVDVSAQLAALA